MIATLSRPRSRTRFVPLALSVLLGLSLVPARPAMAQSDGNGAAASDVTQETLRVFGVDFIEHDRSLSVEERSHARLALDTLRRRAPALGAAALELELARIVAFAGNAHSMLIAPLWVGRYPQVGVRFVITDDGLHVGDALPPYSSLIGARVVRVEGRTLAGLREVWARYMSGRDGLRDQTLPILLETPAMLHAAGVAADSTRFTLELEDGRAVAVADAGEWPAPEGIWRYLAQSRVLALLLAGRISGEPLYLQEPEAVMRVVPLPSRDAVYVQFRANFDFTRQTDLGRASRAVIDTLEALAPRYVIVDQRFNMGGDLNTTRDLMQAIPNVVGADGHVFAITSGRTFSAGIASVGYLKQAAGDRITIVGAPVGDDLEFWAEGSPLELPNGSMILRATERHNYMTGCPEPDCHRSIRIHPIRIDSLEPDVSPPFTWRDLVEGRDPWLEEVLRRIDEMR